MRRIFDIYLFGLLALFLGLPTSVLAQQSAEEAVGKVEASPPTLPNVTTEGNPDLQ